MIRRAALGSILLLVASTGGVSAGGTVVIQVFSNGYTPTPLKTGLDWTVMWHNGSGNDHTATADLFNTFNMFIPAGSDSSTWYVTSAGTFAYHCEIHAGMRGKIKVNPNANPDTGDLSTVFTIYVGVDDQPAGFIEDVQKRKVGKPWRLLASTTTRFVTWTPSSAGTYQFRSRLRKIGTSKATDWGSTTSVQVTN